MRTNLTKKDYSELIEEAKKDIYINKTFNLTFISYNLYAATL